jgi:ABC-type antimicrobial peptide transport system permease subunit
MFRHNIILIYRNFKRFKSTFFINLIGLSTGLTCTLLIYLWVNDELNIDKFHENNNRLFQVMERQQQSEIDVTEGTPGLLAERMIQEFPEIELAVSSTWADWHSLSVGDKHIKAKGHYASKDYFRIFSYPLIHGDKSKVLTDKNSIVISKKLAKILFNTSNNIIGKAIEWAGQKQFIVTGVFEDIPSNSSFQFDFVLSYEEYKSYASWVHDWKNNGPLTYLVLREATNVAEFNRKIADVVKRNGGEDQVRLFVTPYSSKYLYNNYENGIQTGGRITYVKLFSIIALFILIIACINFMNLTTAKASRRIKEIGIKKAVGAQRNILIAQYMGESMAMSFLSLLLAVLLVELSLSQFNEITGKSLALRPNFRLIGSFLSITVMAGFIAGSYPALYLSAFRPAAVLKGRLENSLGELWARKGLVVFQFVVSIVLILSVVVIYRQIEFTQTKNLGYNKDNVIYFDTEGKPETNLELFLSEIRSIPGIQNASSIGHSLVEGGYRSGTSTVQWEGKDPNEIIEFENVRVNYGLIETMGIEIIEGRSFSPEFGSEADRIILNETAVKVMGLKDPVGKEMKVWDEEREIIGVARDFHFQSLHEKVKPLFFNFRPKQTWLIMAKLEAGKEPETIDRLLKFYREYNPGFPLDLKFFDEAYEAQYTSERRVAKLSRYFGGIAILISCLGLFGLAAFTAERRRKEIGIRKVLGSSVFGIVYLLSADFTQIVFIAILMGLPISYLVSNKWLGSFAYKIDLKWWYFVGAGLIALIIAWLTVGSQAIKAASINPTKCLRNE